MTNLMQDLRYAARSLARSPGFTLAAVVILALGIGANTAIFSLVDAVVLHPLPGVAAPSALVDLPALSVVSYPWYQAARADTASAFSGLSAWRGREMSLASGGVAERISGAVVSGNYFQVLGVLPTAGRLFQPSDEQSGEAIAVLGNGIWKTRFGSDPSIVGKVVRLNGSPFTVVGLTPEGFRGEAFGMAPEVWVPIGSWPRLATGPMRSLDLNRRGWGWLSLFGRLKPGVSMAGAQSALELSARQQSIAFPDDVAADTPVTLQPTVRAAAGFGQAGDPAGFLGILVAAVTAALLIACANLANLLLARAAARRKEIAVRQALGASRGRLVRQLLTESVALSALGGAAGILVASWALGLIVKMPLPGDFSLALFHPMLDARALGYALLLSLATGVAFGLLPALQASRLAVRAALGASGAAASPRSATRGALVAAQVALCLVLLVTAGLLGRSLQRALSADLGFERRGVTLASVHLGLQRYEAPRAAAFLKELRQRVEASAGVRAASWAGLVPLSGGEWVEGYEVEGHPAAAGKHPEVGINVVGAGLFRTISVPIAAGRDFDDDLDREGSTPVAMINEAMAKREWPGASPLGRVLKIAGTSRTVVGVTRDFKSGSFRDEAAAEVYLPLSQDTAQGGLQGITLFVSAAPGIDVGGLVRGEIRRLDPTLPVFGLHSFDTELRGQLLAQRLGAAALGLFGVLSLVLAAVGIYAVVSYSVARRTREIGIRMALGARSADVRALVVAQSARPLLIGLVLGVALGAGAARLLQGFLFGISPSDPPTFLAVTALLGACGLAAAWLPARRAARVDPMIALRTE